ncbi:MAG TPA: LytR C-terminal domain-containing protein [bacterium]|nr:LytR C-terminal domain-containing protein [bacterium]
MKTRALVVGGVVVLAGLLLRGPVGLGGVPERERGRPIRVEVLNGSGVNRAGQGLAEHLRAEGFDVVDIRNADRADYEETVVLDRAGNRRFAESVARELGAGDPVTHRDEDLLLEVTVILGRDRAKEFVGGVP